MYLEWCQCSYFHKLKIETMYTFQRYYNTNECCTYTELKIKENFKFVER